MSDWYAREQDRFARGIYTLPPWWREPWWRVLSLSGACATHYAHVSRRDPSLLAYVASEEHGEADRHTQMKPGRYLAKFAPFLSPDQVKHWASVWAAEHEAPVLRLATTADEIERVYTSGPSSCMSAAASAYASPFHPVRVYAAGDLAVAYLVRAESITARAVVWPAKKLYSRIYGDGPRLCAALEAEGYRSGKLYGARLTRVSCRQGFAMPYIDYHERAVDDGDFLRLSEEGYIEVQTQTGIGEADPECEDCEERRGVESFSMISGDRHDYCPSCAENLMRCDGCSGWMVEDECIQVKVSGRTFVVCAPCAARLFHHCETHDTYCQKGACCHECQATTQTTSLDRAVASTD